MKPKTEAPAKPARGKLSKENDKAPSNGTAPSNSKKKQSGAANASGRKMARKTAHSLIERRRRSKMNEEFSTLKDMIPACRGQEMHKLAILQVSWLCYLGCSYLTRLRQASITLTTLRNVSRTSRSPALTKQAHRQVLPLQHLLTL